MSRQFTISELATKVRIRGDYENSEFMSDAILIDFIDSAHTEVYDILVSKFEGYFITEATFSTASGCDKYEIPADFYKLLGLDIDLGGQFSRLFKFNLHERNMYQAGATTGRRSYRYRLQGEAIKLIPTPTSADTIKITYIPVATKFTALTDIVDGVNGWEELVVLFALRRCQVREETSTSTVDGEIARQVARIEVNAGARDAGEPDSLQDIHFNRDWLY